MEELKKGDRVEILRKGHRLNKGTVIAIMDANTDEPFSKSPYWIVTLDIDGLGPRTLRDGAFKAKGLKRFGYVRLNKIEGE